MVFFAAFEQRAIKSVVFCYNMIVKGIKQMKNDEKIVLAVDFGTQSVRVSLVNQSGKIIAIVKNKYIEPYFSNSPGFAEQDANYYWLAFGDAISELKEKNPETIKQVLAMSITTFRDSPVFLDEKFEQTRPMVLWLDQRQAALHKKPPLFNRLIFKVIGMLESVYLNMKRTPAIWVQENEPEVWARTKYYVNISTYINYKLLGKLIDSSANQTGHFPIHFKKGVWYKEKALKNIYQVNWQRLTHIVPQGSILGTINEEMSRLLGVPVGTPIYATGPDKGCEATGTGATNREVAAISYGTASSIIVPNKRYIEPEQFLPAYCAPFNDLYHLEVQIYRGYWMVGWFIKEFGSDESLEAKIEALAEEEVLNNKMLEIPPGSDGLVLQPYWGPGLKRPEARGAIVGFNNQHTRLHIYRAIIEGIAYALRDGLETIEWRQNHKVKEIRVSGGGSQSDAICQITADVFGLPVKRSQTYETAIVGTALTTFYYLKEFKTIEEAVEKMVHLERTFTPNMENHARYDELYYNVYKMLYPRLKGVYKKLYHYK